MTNWIPDWIKVGKAKPESEGNSPREKQPTLEDVKPLHPYEYPARHMKEMLDTRRDMLEEIGERSHPTGLPASHGPET